MSEQGEKTWLTMIHATMTHEISNRSDTIDSRKVNDRIEEISEHGEAIDPADRGELTVLTRLLASIVENEAYGGHADDGMFLIRESYWVEYVKDSAEEMFGNPWIMSDPRHGGPMYDMHKNQHVRVTWDDVRKVEPFGFIDWQAYARHRRGPAPEIEYDGVTYIID